MYPLPHDGHGPAHLRRQPSGFVGLKNGGATCYMNAVFQQLFMQPSIRALVLGAREEPLAARDDSPFFQLQACRPVMTPHAFGMLLRERQFCIFRSSNALGVSMNERAVCHEQ